MDNSAALTLAETGFAQNAAVFMKDLRFPVHHSKDIHRADLLAAQASAAAILLNTDPGFWMSKEAVFENRRPPAELKYEVDQAQADGDIAPPEPAVYNRRTR